jgi:hypothetical protein
MPTGTAGFVITTVIAAGNFGVAEEISEKPGFGRAFCCPKGSSEMWKAMRTYARLRLVA